MEVHVVFYNERSANIAGIFYDKDKAKGFINDGNGEYMKIIETHKMIVMNNIKSHDDALKNIDETTPEFASEILRILTFHFIQPKEHKKRDREDTNIILAALNKSIMLLEKQIPKKAERIGSTQMKCTCGAIIRLHKFCPYCGQALDGFAK
jgi:hypothetical protein